MRKILLLPVVVVVLLLDHDEEEDNYLVRPHMGKVLIVACYGTRDYSKVSR